MKASKLDPLYSGPFKVTHINHWTDNYSCDFTEFPELQAIHNKFHISALKPAEKPKTFTKQDQKPGPVEDDRWEVEKVLEFRTHPRTGAKQYKVRWQGWTKEHDQWINKEDLDSELIETF